MTVMQAIEERTSIRRFTDRPVEEEKLQRVLEAGRQAPSARNTQAWKFIAVCDGKVRQALGMACCNQSFVGQAPVVLVICANETRNMTCKQPARTVDCSIALSFMMLEATACGLSTCWIGAFEEQQVRDILQIPAEYEIVAVSPLGYPAQQGRPHDRKAMGEIVYYDQWGKGRKE